MRIRTDESLGNTFFTRNHGTLVLLPCSMHRHFTATAFVIDSHNRTLLLWHKRLSRWMPPGGHIDENETPEETAKRECKEETGLDVEIVGDLQEDIFQSHTKEGCLLKKPFTFLLENIPPCPERGELFHQHMDFVYLARPINEQQILTLAHDEGTELRWFTMEEVEELDEKTDIFANVKRYTLSILHTSITTAPCSSLREPVAAHRRDH